MKATLDIILRVYQNPLTHVIVAVVVVMLLGLGYFGFKVTKGFIIGYMKANIGDNLKMTFLLIHGFGSFILAMILPNNYLNGIDFIRGIYEQNELWIGASIVTLLFIFLLLFGTLFTLLTGGKIKDIEDASK